MSGGGYAPSTTGGTGKPEQSLFGLWNISFGFFGIQIGFALQNANVSRIFQSLGTAIDDLPLLWIAAPLTGLLVQPLIGHFSDRTWGRFGRRRPYFLAGALLAALALVLMPNAGGLLFAAMLLWILDASLNVSMEPFRAFVGDMLPQRQHAAGYAFQTGFIGAGAVVASLAPTLLNDVFGLANTAPEGQVPPSVRMAFYIGAAALFLAVMWTILTTREYPPEALRRFEGAREDAAHATPRVTGGGPAWLAAGVVALAIVAWFDLDKQLYLLGALLAGYGVAKTIASARVRAGKGADALTQIVGDLGAMPETMRRLCVVQFCTWSALFIMWIFTTPIVAQRFFGSADPASAAYNEGADWVGVLFATYNGVAAIAAFALPLLARAIGLRATHMVCLLAGALGYASFLVLASPTALIGSMALIGIAWASILTMPYAILCDALPQQKLGIYMGLFNIFIVLPQLIVSSVMGPVVKTFFMDDPTPVMLIAAGVLTTAALAMLRVPETRRPTAAPAGRPAPAE